MSSIGYYRESLTRLDVGFDLRSNLIDVVFLTTSFDDVVDVVETLFSPGSLLVPTGYIYPVLLLPFLGRSPGRLTPWSSR